MSVSLCVCVCQVVDIWALLRASYAPFLMQARQKEIHMSLTLEGEGEGDRVGGGEGVKGGGEGSSPLQLRVIGDAVKLTQVMRNLLSNALKFTPHAGRIVVTGMLVLLGRVGEMVYHC